jgi:hypothetical protein
MSLVSVEPHSPLPQWQWGSAFIAVKFLADALLH